MRRRRSFRDYQLPRVVPALGRGRVDPLVGLLEPSRAVPRQPVKALAADRRRYRGLLLANLLLLKLPQRWLGPAAAMMARPRLLRRFFGSYLRIGLAAAK